MTPTCTARIYGCPATPGWSQWSRSQRGDLAGTGPHVTALIIVGVTLVMIGALMFLAARQRNGRHAR